VASTDDGRAHQLGGYGDGTAADRQYRWLTDESEAASGDGIVVADEFEYIDHDAD
jgi:hypothetical protein